MTYNLTANSPTYDSAAQKFGTGALSSGYGYTTASPISGFPFTVEGWAKSAAIPSQVAVPFGQGNAFWVGVNASGIVAWQIGTGALTTTSTTWPLNAWNHLRIVATASTATLCLNGVAIGTMTNPAALASTDFAVGAYGGEGGSATAAAFPWNGEVDEVALWPTALATSFTPQAAAYAGTEGMVALYHLDGNLTDSTAAQIFAPNNASIFYSPGNWLVQAASAETNTPGAYLQTYFTGSNAPTLSFNTTNDTTPLPQIYVVVDDQAPQLFTLAASISPAMPAATSAWPRHSLRVVFRSMNATADSWSARQASIVLTGIQLSMGAALDPYTPAPLTGIAFGDSITQGWYTLNNSGGSGNLATNSDATLSAPYLMGELLGAEIGIVGFGGQWLLPIPATGGAVVGKLSNNNVPPLSQTFNLLWASQPRSFPANLDFVLINILTNDINNGANAAGIANGFALLLNGLLADTPSTCKIIVMEPYDMATIAPGLVSAVTTAIAAAGSSRVSYLSTTGWIDIAQTNDTVHPYGVMNMELAGRLAAAIRPMLAVAATVAGTVGTAGGLRPPSPK